MAPRPKSLDKLMKKREKQRKGPSSPKAREKFKHSKGWSWSRIPIGDLIMGERLSKIIDGYPMELFEGIHPRYLMSLTKA